jgi:hypothetical protein
MCITLYNSSVAKNADYRFFVLGRRDYAEKTRGDA